MSSLRNIFPFSIRFLSKLPPYMGMLLTRFFWEVFLYAAIFTAGIFDASHPTKHLPLSHPFTGRKYPNSAPSSSLPTASLFTYRFPTLIPAKKTADLPCWEPLWKRGHPIRHSRLIPPTPILSRWETPHFCNETITFG